MSSKLVTFINFLNTLSAIVICVAFVFKKVSNESIIYLKSIDEASDTSENYMEGLCLITNKDLLFRTANERAYQILRPTEHFQWEKYPQNDPFDCMIAKNPLVSYLLRFTPQPKRLTDEHLAKNELANNVFKTCLDINLSITFISLVVRFALLLYSICQPAKNKQQQQHELKTD